MTADSDHDATATTATATIMTCFIATTIIIIYTYMHIHIKNIFIRLTIVVENASKDLLSQQQLRDELRAKLRLDRKQGQLLTKDSITELTKLDSRVKELSKRVKLSRVNLDMEKICVYLQRELESSIEQSEQRKIIAEVGLIDKQLSAIMAVVPEQQAFQSISSSSSSSVGSGSGSVNADNAWEGRGEASSGIYNSGVSNNNNNDVVGGVAPVDESDTAGIDKIITDYLTLIDDDELNVISMEVGTVGISIHHR